MIWAEAARDISHVLCDAFPPQQSLFTAWRILADMSGEPLESILPWKSNTEMPECHTQTFKRIVSRLRNQEPIEYIFGKASFCSLELTINTTALIPRPETEILVESVVNWHKLHQRIPETIIDLGTGSGCIALALAHAFPDVHITTVDRSLGAINLTKKNVSIYNMSHRFSFVVSDWWSSLERGHTWDVVISNPPYIKHSDLAFLPPSVREFEPSSALDGGEDGLSGFRAVITGAIHGLRPTGILALECGWNQAGEVLTIIENSDAFNSCTVEKDLNGVPRIIIALRKENLHAS